MKKTILKRILIIIIIILLLSITFYYLKVPNNQVINFDNSQSFISYSNKIKICIYNDFKNGSGKLINLNISFKLINSLNKVVLIKNNITLHDFTAYSKVIYIHPGYYTLLFSYNFSNYTSSYSGILIKELFLYRPYFILYPLYFALSFSTLILMLTTIYDKKIKNYKP